MWINKAQVHGLVLSGFYKVEFENHHADEID